MAKELKNLIVGIKKSPGQRISPLRRLFVCKRS